MPIPLLGSLLKRLLKSLNAQSDTASLAERHQRLLHNIGERFCDFTLSVDTLCVTEIGTQANRLFKRPPEQLFQRPLLDAIDWLAEDKQRLESALQRLPEQHQHTLELQFTTAEKDIRTTKLTLDLIFDARNIPLYIEGLFEDITDQIQAQHELVQAANVFHYSQEGIIITDRTGHILNLNDAFTRITGYTKAEILGKTPNILSSGRHDKLFYAELWQELFAKGSWSGEIWNRRKNGEIYPEKMTISSILDDNGAPREFIAQFSDISLQKKQQSQLEFIAHFDPLTGLPNRTLLADRLNQAISYAKGHQLNLAVLFIDLDGFKAINDFFGHQAGDQLLISIATRLKQVLREEDTIARIGGDEFVAVLLDTEDTPETHDMLERLLREASKPVSYESNQLRVSASIGVSFYNQQNELDADQIIRQADQAMYQAKMKGKNQLYVFEEETYGALAQSEELKALEAGLNRGELRLFFQPKINLHTGIILGFESLIRWQHPEKGILPPIAFLPLLRDHPLSAEIGFWVIEAALKQIQAWQNTGFASINLSVNIEGDLLQETNFVDRLRYVLQAYPSIQPSQLTLEILETSALEDIFSVSKTMKDCSDQIGVRFSIDDFGTGYASLTYLKHLPVSELKVDQSFVKDLLTDPQSLSIMESIIGMGEAFQLDVIAEGVETDEQATLLLKLGCQQAQGYHISRPMPAEAVPKWIQQWQAPPHWQRIHTLSKDDLTLVAAATQHRAWLKQLHGYIYDEIDTPPPLEAHQCEFGHWLKQHGLDVFETASALETVEKLHEQVHQASHQIVHLKQNGELKTAKQRLDELEHFKDGILNQLNQLTQAENSAKTPASKAPAPI